MKEAVRQYRLNTDEKDDRVLFGWDFHQILRYGDMVEIDVVSCPKHLYNPLMPARSRPQEWRSAIYGVRLVRIDVISFQKHLYYPLMPVRSCPREWSPAIFGVWQIRIDVLSL